MIAGRYSLEREIGRGGMGAVWLGRDDVLGRPVALKRVGLAPGETASDLDRAEREARLAARLNHPHVVAVFDLVDEAGERWLVMEHVPGTDLAALVRARGPLPPDEAAALIAQAADALAAAHAAGIVHRDVKPSNMLVTDAGQLKLSDFGIARAEADASLTRTGLVTGSPAYLAPEVASGRLASPRSDVWSLGASLFHALAGRPPFDATENMLGALYKIVHEEPPRLDHAGWLTPLLAATMATEPGDRWPMADVRDFLRAGPGARAPRPVPVARAARDDERSRRVARDARPVLDPPPLARPSGRPPVAAGGGPDRPGRRTVLGAVAAAAGLTALALGGYALAQGGSQRSDDPASAGVAPTLGGPSVAPSASASPSASSSPSTAPSTSPSPSPSAESTAPSEPARPTPDGVATFVRDYLRTAATDPSVGYTMLTPGFRRASGGLAGYTGFWGRVRSIDEVSRIEPDIDGPRDITVRYRYRYTLDNGRTRRDDVRLLLRFDQGTYKIAGEA